MVCFIIFFLFFPCFFYESLAGLEKNRIFAPQLRNQCNAQMAESVDALVSNTSGFTSIPVRPRVWVQSWRKMYFFLLFLFSFLVTRWFAEK